jgi:hypothetical protein
MYARTEKVWAFYENLYRFWLKTGDATGKKALQRRFLGSGAPTSPPVQKHG